MSRRHLLLFVLVLVCLATASIAESFRDAGRPSRLIGGALSEAKGCTTYVYGDPATEEGTFQLYGNPDLHGWTSVDRTAPPNHWHRDDHWCDNLPGGIGNRAAYCGEYFDWTPGYGNDYADALEWSLAVPDPGLPTQIHVTAFLNHDSEPGADYLALQIWVSGAWVDMVAPWTGYNVNVYVDAYHTLLPGEYDGDQVRLRWFGFSDAVNSDEDEGYVSAGLSVVDDVQVEFNGTPQSFDDFETGLGSWTAPPNVNVGRFAAVWTALVDELDACEVNGYTQVAFIDDGVVEPGTGGSPGTTWTYGPGGYVVNSTGGLAGGSETLWNEVWSPPLELGTPACDGAYILEFDVYLHAPLDQGSAGIFGTWAIRFSDNGGMRWSEWLTHDDYLYGGPGYLHVSEDVTDLVRWQDFPVTHVQIALGVREVDDPEWGGTDATPAPWYDNVKFYATEATGPYLWAHEADLPQDAFPAAGAVSPILSENSVRCDAARNTAPRGSYAVIPGDSLVITAGARDVGVGLADFPYMYYVIDANPAYDPARLHPTSGYFTATECYDEFMNPVIDRWCFDVPDEGFLFPGDEMHFYFEAVDGNAVTATLPAGPPTGFGDFSASTHWPRDFTMRALPGQLSDIPGHQPPILVWIDHDDPEDTRPWTLALHNAGYDPEQDYDLYVTRAPAAGHGNGIGRTAGWLPLEHYDVIAYDSGDLDHHTLTAPDGWDAGDDLGTLEGWLDLGYRNLVLCGDHLCSSLDAGDVAEAAFLTLRMEVDVLGDDVRPGVEGQDSPVVLPFPPTSMFSLPEWRLIGDCPNRRSFDALEAPPPATMEAEFAGLDGLPSPFGYAAVARHDEASTNSVLVTMPFSVRSIADAAAKGMPSARSRVVEDLMAALGVVPSGTINEQKPDITLSAAWTAATVPVSIAVMPDDTSTPLTEARAYGGAITDATITVEVLDNTGTPIVGMPPEDVWLESTGGGFVHTPGGSLADGPTDSVGRTTFSGPLSGGGHTEPGEDLVVMLNGEALAGSPLDIRVNSPDIDADLDVDLKDLVHFAEDFWSCGGPYDYESDYFWDDVVDLADLVVFAHQGWGAGDRTNAEIDLLPSVVGIYFDDGGCWGTALPDTSGEITAYILLETTFSDVAAWEMQLEITGDPIYFVSDSYNGASNYMQDDQRFTVAGCSALPVVDGQIILAEINLMLLSTGGSHEFYIQNMDPSSIPFIDEPAFLTSALDSYKVMLPASGDQTEPLCAINSPGNHMTGNIVVLVTPNLPELEWRLAGLNLDTTQGGSAAVPDVALGHYSLDWQKAHGWKRPDPTAESDCLTRFGALVFEGTYQPAGYVRVDPDPDALDAGWHLTGPGVDLTGNGDVLLDEMLVGEYTLAWDPVAGWQSPPDQVLTLAQYDTITFAGTYLELTPEPRIESIVDVDNDHGRHVRITWVRSLWDAPDDTVTINGYGIYRRQDEWKGRPLTVERDADGKMLGWDSLGTVAARYDSLYSFVAETLCDSTDAGICWSVFMVSTETPDPGLYHDSAPDSGYSVDNLVPHVPEGLRVDYAIGGNVLDWNPNRDPDLRLYRVYRGDLSGGDCGERPAEPYAQVATDGWTDPLAGGTDPWDHCYWVTAVDFAGNESEPTVWEATGTTGADQAPRPLALLPPAPNPFNPQTVLAFDLPAPASVVLEIYDVSGRRVRTLLDGVPLGQGRRDAVWRGRDDAGRIVPAGVYFARLQVDGRSLTRRLTLVK